MIRYKVRQNGFTAIELLAVATIVGIIALIIVPRLTNSSDSANQMTSAHQKAIINAAVERFYVRTGAWPAEDLSDIGADADYFPDGIPLDPIDDSAYKLNQTTHRVE